MTLPKETPMIEKCARALCLKDGIDPDELAIDYFPDGDGPFWRCYESDVRAVLTALRDPTPEMVEAAYEADLDINWGYAADGRPCGSGDVWRAMIDRALNEGEG